jgi:hypothetical protein
MKYGILGLVVAATYYGVAPATHRHAATTAGGAQQGQEWSWSGRVADGKTLEVRGVNGAVSAEPASGNQVEVRAQKHGRRDDPDDVRIEVVEHADGVTICAVYPGRSNECRPGGGRMNVRDNDVEVDFTVRVPRGVRFEGNTVNGGVEALNLEGPVELNTVNGGVRLETASGDAEANTVNGSITATVRALGERPLRFETVNGGITVSLPASLDADLAAETVNGSIQTDFPIQVQGRMNPRELNGRIGRGGRTLALETVNGSIRLRRLP